MKFKKIESENVKTFVNFNTDLKELYKPQYKLKPPIDLKPLRKLP